MVKAEVPGIPDASSIDAAEGGEGWHSELPRVKFDAFLGKIITILEVDWRDSSYGQSDDETPKKQYALLRVQCPDSVPGTELQDEGEKAVIVEPGHEVTTSTGRVRVCEQIRKAKTLPVKGEVAIGGKTSGGFDIWELRPVGE